MAEEKRSKIWSENTKILAKFMENNKLNNTQAAAELGLSSSTISTYMTEGKMPFTVELAVKYLDERRSDPDGVKHYLLTVAGEEAKCCQLEELEEMTMGANRYKLVPI